MIARLNVDTSKTKEKFRHYADELLNFLLGNLKLLDELEKEIFLRHQSLAAERPTVNQVHPDEDDLWAEYDQRSKAIIAPIVCGSYKMHTRSFGEPSKYAYLNYPDTKIILVMKSEDLAKVEVHFNYGVEQKNQFTLERSGSYWKIRTKKYGFQGETTWHTDEL